MKLHSVIMVISMALSCFACASRDGAALKSSVEQAQDERQPEKLIAIGDAYASVGDSVRSAQYYSLAIENGGSEKAIFPRLLEVCIRDRQFRAALSYVENYLRKHPRNAKLRFLAGSLYASLGDAKLARTQYESAIVEEPRNAELRYALAVLSRDHDGDLLAADSHFRAYLKLEPSGAHAEEARQSLLEAVP